MASDTTRPAANESPLRQLAQAVDFLVNGVLADRTLAWLILPILLVPYAALEWLRFIFEAEPAPGTVTLIAIGGVGAAVFMIRRNLTEAREEDAHDRGDRVEDALEQLAAKGYQLFHAIRCGDFKLEHVAVGPTGVYTVEAKTLSKPIGKRARIVVDRDGLAAAGQPPSQSVLARSTAEASCLADLLKEQTGKAVRVRPVLLFPGWSVVQKCPRKVNDPWVLDTAGFLKMVERGQALLNEEQVALASFYLWRLTEESRNEQ